MKIKYIGHSCFLFTAVDETAVIIDPYKSGAYGGSLTYAPITDSAHIAVLTHDHEDHAAVDQLSNSPLVVRTSSRTHGIDFDAIETFHDDSGGSERGANRVFVIEMDEIRLCHLGDLGHLLNEQQQQSIGRVDVLMIPVGGHFTIGPQEADQVVEQLQPRIVIPMHFKTDRCGFPIESAETFLADKNEVRRSTSSEVILRKEDVPEKRTFLYLPPSN